MPRGLGSETVQRFIDAFNAGDLDAFVETLDPSVEIHSMKGVRRGIEQARAWATRPPGGVQQQVTIEALRPNGDRILALVARRWHWAEDGERAGEDAMAWLFTLRDGRIVRWQPFEDRAEALAAAGLE